VNKQKQTEAEQYKADKTGRQNKMVDGHDCSMFVDYPNRKKQSNKTVQKK
jgi:hypothetical protein